MYKKKLEAIKERTHPNIKSGNVIISTKDRDWLIATLENLIKQTEDKSC